MKTLLSGNEAIARGAYESGVLFAAAYPGTPSTEILETLTHYPEVRAEWATNEKVALDSAIGAAYAGGRALAAMKHVGLNVAADSLFYVSMTGIKGGLVIVTADDPAMHSSQNEQDNRRFAKFARLPCLEPTDSQDAKDLVQAGLEMSEAFDTPVLLRITTRIAHSHSLVELGERAAWRPQEPFSFPHDVAKYVMVPANARRMHPVIEQRITRLAEFAESFAYNRVELGDPALGIITNGVAYQYAREVFPTASFLRLGMTYPLPPRLVRDFAASVGRLIVIEELDPFIEEEVRLMGIPVEGKRYFPMVGELDIATVRGGGEQAGLLPAAEPAPTKAAGLSLPIRPPVLCPGCPHRGVFVVTNKYKLTVNGDIGCYTLGFLPPLGGVHTCGCMGASIGVAHGANQLGVKVKNVATIGDSTFFHTGMPALLNVVYNRGDTITFIMDNRTTAMTGHQGNPGNGMRLEGQPSPQIDFEQLVRALGVAHVWVVDPYDLKAVDLALNAALKVEGPAVIISQRACALLPEAQAAARPIQVDLEICNGCGVCLQIGCPAMVLSTEVDAKTGRTKVQIDPLLCTGCEVCAQVCARHGIAGRGEA